MGFQERVFLSEGEKLSYILLAIPIAVYGALANAWYLFWLIRDSHMRCSFNMLLGSLALCEMIRPLAILTHKVVILYNMDRLACTTYQIVSSAVELEVAMILVFIAVDRVYFLLRGAFHYRHVITPRRTCLTLVMLWVADILLNALLWHYHLGNSINVVDADQCQIFSPHFIAVLPIAFDVVVLSISILILKRYQLAHVPASSFSLSRVASSMTAITDNSRPQLHARGCAAYGLDDDTCQDVHFSKVQAFKPPETRETRLGNIDENEEQKIDCLETKLRKDAEESRINGETKKDDYSEAEDGENRRQKIVEPSKESTPFKGNVQSEEPRGQGLTFGRQTQSSSLTHFSARDNKSFERTRSSQRNLLSVKSANSPRMSVPHAKRAAGGGSTLSDITWASHPKIKSTLHALWHRHLGRAEVMAAHQVGIILLVHFILGTPVYTVRFIGSVRTDLQPVISGLVHWLDLIALLQACIFPVIYCLYSDRLRFHLRFLRCRCQCQHHRKVSVLSQSANHR